MVQGDDHLAELLAGDARRHFRRVVETYQHRLFTFALRLTGSAQDAEDVVQETFVRAYVACATYRPERVRALKLQPWLYKIALNEFHHHTRRARLHVLPVDVADDAAALAIADAAEAQPDFMVEGRERVRELEEAVRRLPDHYRIPVLCYYAEHLSYQDIAELLDAPLGTVKSAISRGVRLLRTILRPPDADTSANTSWSRMIPNGTED